LKRFPDCQVCLGAEGDADLHRVQVWEDELWRVTTSLASEVAGLSYLEPKRHIPFVTDLDGEEARTFGVVLARATTALKAVTGAGYVYLYVFGMGIPHLHVHLAPHREGDALNDRMIRGTVVEQPLPSGAILMTSDEFPPLPEHELRSVADGIRDALS
jgi:diadenosine tetraphosphate (Ap4A) HIT family hydrolase